MARSLFATLHRRFGPKLSGAEVVNRSQAKQAEFVRSMGLATSAPDCSRFFPNGVAIVGGGFAGISAAWTLGQHNIASTIFEARETYGGRVQTDQSLIPGRPVETGAELIGFNHPMWLTLAKRFGLGMIVLTGEDQYAAFGLETQLRLRGRAVTDIEKLYEQMVIVLRKISDDAKAVTNPFEPWKAPNASTLDAKTVAEKIAEYARLVPASSRHPSLVDAIEFELGNDHVLPAREQSYLGLLAVVSGGRLGKDDRNLDGYWTHREDFRCDEGNVTLAGMMIEFGKRAVFRPQSPVQKIEIRDSLVQVTWLDSMRGPRSATFDNVILTVPPSVWNKITITPSIPAGKEMGAGPAVKYVSPVHKRFWIRAGMAPNAFSDELGQTWEPTENQAIASQGVALTVFAGGPYVPASGAEKHFEKEILKLYPDYKPAGTPRYADWPKTQWIETGYACPKVGQVTTIAKFLSVPHAKRLYFAGEHTCMAYFGYMEGALQSGARAARAVVSSCAQLPAPSEEEIVVSASSSRSASEASFLHGLLRELGHSAVPDVSPVRMFRAALGNQPVISGAQGLLTVVAVPAQEAGALLRAGDWMLRATPGTGDIGHVSVLASDNLLTQSMLASENIPSESVQSGYYGVVIEGGAFPHSRSQPFARRLLNSDGRVPSNTVFLRPASGNDDQEDWNPPIPEDVAKALGKQDWVLALKLAIQAGWRDENDLTNLLFFARHPELPKEPLKTGDPNYKQLSAEWNNLNNDVWKAIEASAENTDLAVSGHEVTDHHRSFFRGKAGQRLKKLVEDAAKAADLNPGLLGTIMMAETRRPESYLSSEKVSSYHIGCDDFFEGRAAIQARVPAYSKVRWAKGQTPIEHLNDAQTNPRMVKSILFDSGPDGALATAVYVKFREVRLREIAKELGKDFDSLPLPTRFALTRIAMAAGTEGTRPYLKDALNGVDIFVRQPIPVVAYQTKRNATVRTAQAMHLSNWIFGIPVEAATAPASHESVSEWVQEDNPPSTPTRVVAIGQRVELDLNDVAFAQNAEEIRWTIPGTRVKGYNGTTTEATVLELTEGDLQQKKITFYWVDAADGRIVQARFRIKGNGLGQVAYAFDVTGPTVNSFTGDPGETQKEMKRSGLLWMRFGKPRVAPGIRWKWEITMPSTHAGFIKDVQTVLTDRTKTLRLKPGGAETRNLVWRHPTKTKPHTQLDGDSDSQAAYTAGVYEAKTAAGETLTSGGGVDDSPHTELPSLGTVVSVNDQFTYYLMFKPDTDNAIWVPIAKAKWFWKAKATNSDRGWMLSPEKMKPSPEKKSVEFPLYESNAADNEWQDI
jgi:monoamine oxidase